MRDKKVLIWSAVAAIVIAALVLSYCGIGSRQYRGDKVSPTASVVVPFTRIAQGHQTSVGERVNYRITSAEQLSELWKILKATSTPPTVDFNTHEVLAVFAGPEQSAKIAVIKIEDTSQRMVSITLAKPVGECDAKVLPYEIVAVPTTSLPLTHKDVLTTANCPKR